MASLPTFPLQHQTTGGSHITWLSDSHRAFRFSCRKLIGKLSSLKEHSNKKSRKSVTARRNIHIYDYDLDKRTDIFMKYPTEIWLVGLSEILCYTTLQLCSVLLLTGCCKGQSLSTASAFQGPVVSWSASFGVGSVWTEPGNYTAAQKDSETESIISMGTTVFLR